MENVLDIKDLKYENILKGVTFSLSSGTFNILIGKSGSGKTTIVDSLRGLIKYEGYINYLDNKKIGYFISEEITIENNLFEELNNVLHNLDYEKEVAKKQICNTLKKLDSEDLLYKKDLSNQEKLFINFIFSIIHQPKLLIIDCDLDCFNNKYKAKILNYLKSQKMTILLMTNNSEYFYLADNLFFLNEGKIILSGSLEELKGEEKTFIKCGSKLPYEINLSNKLMAYELIDDYIKNATEMVELIWK